MNEAPLAATKTGSYLRGFHEEEAQQFPAPHFGALALPELSNVTAGLELSEDGVLAGQVPAPLPFFLQAPPE